MAIKRVASLIDVRNLGHIRLWVNDLEAMLKVMDEAVGIRAIRVDDDFSIDAVADLADYGPSRIKSLVAYGERSEVHLSLSEGSGGHARLHLENPDLAVKGMANEVERLAARAQRRIYTIRYYAIAAIAAIFFVLSSAIVLAARSGDDMFWGLLGSIVLCLVVVVAIISARDGRHKSSAAMINSTREDAPPWLTRNRDALVTNTIVSVIAGVVGFFAGKFFG